MKMALKLKSFVFLLFMDFAFGWEAIPLDTPGYEWMDEIIEEEFTLYKRYGITQKMIEEGWNVCKFNSHFKRYQVIDSQVYGEEGRLKNLLLTMVAHYSVPDVDFIYYQHDVVRESFFKYIFTIVAPLFVSAKEKTLNRCILFSDWYYDIKDDQGGWNSLIQSINENQERVPWEKKIEKLFWRGTPTDGFYTVDNWRSFPRGRIVYNAHHVWPDLIDATFSNFLPWTTNDIEGLKKAAGCAPMIPPVDHLAFKYQLIVDGVTCTFPGTQWRLLSGSLSMKQNSDDQMWFFKKLIPWVHYVPVNYDLSDAREKVLWARAHDQEVRQIAENARQFALTHLMPEHILLYCYKVLLKYASLQKIHPNVKEIGECPMPLRK